jgi:multidrug efflux pump
MGLVIFTGISIGTLFTLFVVPAMYMFLGAEHHQAGTKEVAITGETGDLSVEGSG